MSPDVLGCLSSVPGSRRNFGFNSPNGDLYGIPNVAALAGRWVHVAAVFHNGDVTGSKLYINGVAQSMSQLESSPVNGNAFADPTAQISGWGCDPWYRFDGSIDEVAVYAGALTAQQIQDHYAAGRR